MKDDQLLAQLADANAYRDDAPLPSTIWSADESLREITRRTGVGTQAAEHAAGSVGVADEGPVPAARIAERVAIPRWRRGVFVAAAAFLAVLLVGTAAATLSFTGGRNDVGARDAVAVVDGYFSAFGRGDLVAMTELLVPTDPTRFVRVCEDTCDYFDTWSFDYHQRYTAYKMAQGTTVLNRTCTASDPQAGDAVVTCEYYEHEYVASVVGAPPAPTVATFTVTRNGIGAVELAYEGRAPGHAAETQFKAWMSRAHPEYWGSVGQRTWTSADDATAKGELTAEYGDEWAAYLDANGCTYLDGC